MNPLRRPRACDFPSTARLTSALLALGLLASALLGAGAGAAAAAGARGAYAASGNQSC